ncbi:MAG: phage antirepressor protein [Synergistales bacterium]|nr:phage antirepressor protein [Synergistales bacterium]
MNQIQAFSFNSSEVRVVRDEQGEPWFVAKDVCEVLELVNPSEALKALDDDERNTLRISEGIRGNPEMNIISESGMYTLVMRSNKPHARKFRKWVTSEVLPSIRKTGSYAAPQTYPEALRALANEYEMRALAEAQRDEAIRTKALIGSKREATAMATASVAKRRAEALAEKIGESVTWKAVKSIRWLLDIFAESKGMWSSVGKKLKALSDEMGYDVRTIENSDYGQVNAYHRDVIARFRAKLSADPNMLAKYRREEMERSA